MEGVSSPQRGQVQVPHGRGRIEDLRGRRRGRLLSSRQHRGETFSKAVVSHYYHSQNRNYITALVKLQLLISFGSGPKMTDCNNNFVSKVLHHPLTVFPFFNIGTYFLSEKARTSTTHVKLPLLH